MRATFANSCLALHGGLSMGENEDAGLLLHICRSLCLISSMSGQEVPRMAAMIVNDGAGSQDCILERLLAPWLAKRGEGRTWNGSRSSQVFQIRSSRFPP